MTLKAVCRLCGMPFEERGRTRLREALTEHFARGRHLLAGSRYPFHAEDMPSCCPTP